MVTMVPATLPAAHDTPEVRVDGKPTPAMREELRRIASGRNALSVVGLYAQTALLLWLTTRYLWLLPLTFLLMGRTFAQFASLMHEAAHRLLFADKRTNDWVGRWLLGYPVFTSTDAYRRVHMAQTEGGAPSGPFDTAAAREGVLATNLNSCHVWAEDSEHVATLRNGEPMEVPLWITKRFSELGRDASSWRSDR